MVEKEKRLCIKCEKEGTGGWYYIWKGKQGNMCHECGEWFHIVGDYLNERAAEMMTEYGITIDQTKEKFGGWRIYMSNMDPRKEKFVKALHRKYKIMFPEFSWEWDYCD